MKMIAEKKSVKKNRKILFQTGAVIILLFALMVWIVSNMVTITSFSACLTNIRLDQANRIDEIIDDMEAYQALPWLMEYWPGHAEVLAGLKNPDMYQSELDAILAKLGKDDATEVTPEEIAMLSGDEQELFACYCYSWSDLLMRYYSAEYNMEELLLVIPDPVTGLGLVVLAGNRGQDDTLRLGETQDIKELGRISDRLVSAMFGDAGWAVKLPSRDSWFGFSQTLNYGKEDQEASVWSLISGERVYDEMFFVDLFRRMVTLFLVIVGIVILVFLFLIVIRPLSRVKACVREYRRSKNTQKVTEQLSRIRSRNEIGVFADEFSSLVQEIERYTADVAALAGEKERVATELSVAARIQTDMLPRNFPEQKEFELFASMNPAREVGGDFYDFYLIDEDHLALTIADVSDKGVPASLFMAVSKTILKNRTLAGGTPARILEDANNQICEGNDNGMFVTVWLGILTISTGELVCANGGHENPALRLKNEPFTLIRTKHGLPLGVMEDITYDDEVYQLSPQDACFVYTDGVTEATRADETMFSEERVVQVLGGVRSDETPQQILERVGKAVDDFVGDAPQFDDLTMLCVVYHGDAETSAE